MSNSRPVKFINYVFIHLRVIIYRFSTICIIIFITILCWYNESPRYRLNSYIARHCRLKEELHWLYNLFRKYISNWSEHIMEYEPELNCFVLRASPKLISKLQIWNFTCSKSKFKTLNFEVLYDSYLKF